SLGLRLDDVLLRPEAGGVARARRPFDLVPDAVLAVDHLDRLLRQEKVGQRAPEAGLEGEPDAARSHGGPLGLLRRDLGRLPELPGKRKWLAPGDAEERVVVFARERPSASV